MIFATPQQEERTMKLVDVIKHNLGLAYEEWLYVQYYAARRNWVLAKKHTHAHDKLMETVTSARLELEVAWPGLRG